jgi:hypothetical protein
MARKHRRAASVALAKGPVVQLGEQLADGQVEFFEREELVVAQRRHDPALCDLHRIFDFRLSLGLYGRAGTMPKPQCSAKL